MMKNNQIQKIHFIGIGGISMAGLALYVKKQGYNVSGSDNNIINSNLYEKLMLQKIDIYTKHSKDNLKNVDLVVYSSAIKEDNCELSYAKENNIPNIERADFLGYIAKTMKNTIAISGTHGKTTTTALVGWIFYNAKLHPTIHLGGISQNFDTNFIIGSNNIFITEACEYNKSFLSLFPTHSIITNIDKDHLDCYKDFMALKKSFSKFVNQTSKYVIYCGDNINNNLFKNKTITYISYGFNKKNQYTIKSNKIGEYIVFENNKEFIKGTTQLLGDYNLLNILVSIIIAKTFNISKRIITNSIASFKGVKRRFEYITNIGKSDLYIDYAHHPNEIKALLNSCKKLKYKKIIMVFQPHTYSRTKLLFNEFLKCFTDCDELILVPTYPARESIIEGGKSEDIFNAIKKIKTNTLFYKDKQNLKEHLNNYSNQNNLILLVGAGNIDKLFS